VQEGWMRVRKGNSYNGNCAANVMPNAQREILACNSNDCMQ